MLLFHYRGFVKSVERFVKANEEQLELETGQLSFQSTDVCYAVITLSIFQHI